MGKNRIKCFRKQAIKVYWYGHVLRGSIGKISLVFVGTDVCTGCIVSFWSWNPFVAGVLPPTQVYICSKWTTSIWDPFHYRKKVSSSNHCLSFIDRLAVGIMVKMPQKEKVSHTLRQTSIGWTNCNEIWWFPSWQNLGDSKGQLYPSWTAWKIVRRALVLSRIAYKLLPCVCSLSSLVVLTNPWREAQRTLETSGWPLLYSWCGL